MQNLKELSDLLAGFHTQAQDLRIKLARAMTLLEQLTGEIPASAPIQPQLYPQEIKVLKLLAQDKTTGEIAKALSLSSKTVGNYRRSIRQKLALSSSQDLHQAAKIWLKATLG